MDHEPSRSQYINFPWTPAPRMFKGSASTMSSYPSGGIFKYLPDIIVMADSDFPVTALERLNAKFRTSGPSGIVHLLYKK
jgi:hypothetical protein